MNLLQQLEQAQRPALSSPVLNRQRSMDNFQKAIAHAWQVRTEKSFNAYRQFMKGKGWLTQPIIERHFGFSKNGATAFLARLVNEFQVVEKRNKGGLKTFKRMTGYEYKWIGD